MRILLHLNQLGERGTESSTFELGRALSHVGHHVSVTYPLLAQGNRRDVQDYFAEEFDMYPYSTFNRDDKWVKRNIDCVYFLKINGLDSLKYNGIFNAVHTVFPEYLPHGDSYTYISSWLADESKRLANRKLRLFRRGPIALAKGCKNALKFESVPHIVDMSKASGGSREKFRIPPDAFLITRYGGYTEFNISWVKEAIETGLQKNKNWFFLGVNTEKFLDHPRALFVPAIINKIEKSNLLSESDVFLHARKRGETFGMSIVEALQIGTRILSFNGGLDKFHIELLKGTDCLYSSQIDLTYKLEELERNKQESPFSSEMREIGDIYRPSKLVGRYEKTIFNFNESVSKPGL